MNHHKFILRFTLSHPGCRARSPAPASLSTCAAPWRRRRPGHCRKTSTPRQGAGSPQRNRHRAPSRALSRRRLRRRAGPPRRQPGRPHPVDHSRRRPGDGPEGRGQPRPGQETAGRRAGAERPGQHLEALYACLYYTQSRGTAPPRTGRIFQTSQGGIIQDSAYSAVWADARCPPPRSPAAPGTESPSC